MEEDSVLITGGGVTWVGIWYLTTGVITNESNYSNVATIYLEFFLSNPLLLPLIFFHPPTLQQFNKIQSCFLSSTSFTPPHPCLPPSFVPLLAMLVTLVPP